MSKKKSDRKPPKRFLSVAPVTSRENTGATSRQVNLRALMKQRVRVLLLRRTRDQAEIARLTAAIIALGKRK